MERRLQKTFLSRKTSPESLIIAVLGLAVLFLFFTFDQKTLSANGLLIFEKKEYWRAFTTTLLHADLNHLAHNAFFFTGLAALLHNYFGFWVFPVLSLIAGALINIICLYFYPPGVSLVGVSGVIYFMASFWLVLYLFVEKRQTLKVRILHAMAVSLIFFFPEAFQPQTSYLAHGVGFALGLPMGAMYYYWHRKRIIAQEVWVEVKKEKSPMDNVILMENGDFVILDKDE